MLDEQWQLNGSVALRPEPFGALAYDFNTRRLSFLKSPQLVSVVEAMGPGTTVRSALEAAGVHPDQWSAYLKALASLAESRMILPADAGKPQPADQESVAS